MQRASLSTAGPIGPSGVGRVCTFCLTLLISLLFLLLAVAGAEDTHGTSGSLEITGDFDNGSSTLSKQLRISAVEGGFRLSGSALFLESGVRNQRLTLERVKDQRRIQMGNLSESIPFNLVLPVTGYVGISALVPAEYRPFSISRFQYGLDLEAESKADHYTGLMAADQRGHYIFGVWVNSRLGQYGAFAPECSDEVILTSLSTPIPGLTVQTAVSLGDRDRGALMAGEVTGRLRTGLGTSEIRFARVPAGFSDFVTSVAPYRQGYTDLRLVHRRERHARLNVTYHLRRPETSTDKKRLGEYRETVSIGLSRELTGQTLSGSLSRARFLSVRDGVGVESTANFSWSTRYLWDWQWCTASVRASFRTSDALLDGEKACPLISASRSNALTSLSASAQIYTQLGYVTFRGTYSNQLASYYEPKEANRRADRRVETGGQISVDLYPVSPWTSVTALLQLRHVERQVSSGGVLSGDASTQYQLTISGSRSIDTGQSLILSASLIGETASGASEAVWSVKSQLKYRLSF